ncbi:g10447 [Coccomyxa viridis]|uniref:G10447 protein n=1 Tax=Coccomyxa viridis TaxID=1274662 RepID=A0ABP1G7X3_9CHLO
MGLELSRGSLTCQHCDARRAVNHDHSSFSINTGTKARSVLRDKPRQRLHCIRAEPQLQELIVGGAVLTAVTAAIVNGFKGEPKICDLCQGVGGTKCFACSGSGLSKSLPERKLAPGGLKRDFLGRVPDPEACRVCGGSGMNLCSRCRGSGYLRSL